MNAISQAKTPSQNRLEGFLLTALLLGLPTCAGAVLMLKLVGAHRIVGERWGAVIFAVLAWLLHGALMPWLGQKFPRVSRLGYEPLFFDCHLRFSEKIAQWRVQPATSAQLVTRVIMMSLLAVAVVSI